MRLSGMSKAQRRAYVIADNRLAETAGWDEDLLRLEIGSLRRCRPNRKRCLSLPKGQQFVFSAMSGSWDGIASSAAMRSMRRPMPPC